MNSLIGMTIVLIVFCTLLTTLRAWQRKANPDPELVRKLFHLGMGIFTLSLPWLFASVWPVMVMCSVTVTLLLAIRHSPPLQRKFGAVLSNVARCSHGELYFSLGVATLFVWAKNDRLFYLMAILLLTFADAAAALVGKRFGAHPYSTLGGRKSVEGSLAFLTVAVVCIYAPLALTPNVDAAAGLLLALAVALLLTILEALATRGLDNLVLPLAAYALLRNLQSWTSDELNTLLVGVVLLTVAFLLAAGFHRRGAAVTQSFAEKPSAIPLRILCASAVKNTFHFKKQRKGFIA